MNTARRLRWSAALLLAFCPSLQATTIPGLTFEQLTDASDLIASGRVTQSWTSWDSEHKYIWTHYALSVTDSVKGGRTSTVEFAEPGGAINGASMLIAGSVTYAIGDNVLVFLSRMPNGYLRTNGWSQGKYRLDSAGRLHGSASIGAEMVNLRNPLDGTALRTLNGMTLSELRQRVAARARSTGRIQ